MRIPISKNSLWRLVALTVGGLVLAVIIPPLDKPLSQVAAGFLAVFFLMFAAIFILQAEERRRTLHRTVAVELNRLRRIYHVAKNLSVANEAFRPWFTELHGYVYAYLTFFSDKTFADYDKSNADFRHVSYHVYTIPEVVGGREEALYRDLLKTTAEVAQARQRIKEISDSRLSATGWVALLLVAVAAAVAVCLTVTNSIADRLFAGFVVAAIALIVDYLWDIDALSAESRDLADRYSKNVSQLELHREE